MEVVSTKTTADVMWKDGQVEKGIRSNDLIPIQHLDSHEFCPGDFVVDKRRKEPQLHLWSLLRAFSAPADIPNDAVQFECLCENTSFD